MWTPEIIRIRFVEAAATERFLPTLRRPDARGYWPEFLYSQDDRDGWDQAAKDDHLQIWQGRGTAKADALSRYQECLSWTIERITHPERRRLVWGFAFCRAYKREFGKWCEDRGQKKSTAYNRLNRIWSHLANDFNNDGLVLREPSSFWVGHESPRMACICATEGPGGTAPPSIKFTPGYRTEPSRDMIVTDDDAANFARFLTASNASGRAEQSRRAEREAARRRKLGLDAA